MKRPFSLLAVPLLALGAQAHADFYSHRYAGVSFASDEISGFCDGSAAFLRSANAVEGQSLTGLGCGEGGDSWKIYGGWRWTPYLALEASVHQLSSNSLEFEARFDSGEHFVQAEEQDTKLGNVFLVGHWPLLPGMSLFGKLGGGFWGSSMEIRQNGEMFRAMAQIEDHGIQLLPRGDDQNVSQRLPSGPGEVIYALKPFTAEGELNDSGAHWVYGVGLSYRYRNNWTLRVELERFSSIGSDDLRSEFDLETLSMGWSMHF